MTGSRPARPDTVDATAPELLAAVVDAALPCFSDLVPGRTEVRVRWHRDRLRCSLAALDLVHGEVSHAVIVKVRADRDAERAGERHGRPRVAGGEVAAREAAVLEHAGLLSLEQAVSGRRSEGLRAVPALAVVPDLAALVMGEVAQPTLKDVLQHGSRQRRARGLDLRPWGHAGELLAAYQQVPAQPQARPWLSTTREIADLLAALVAYLRSRRATEELLGGVERRAADLLARAPLQVPLAPSHGDFVPRNLFVHDDGAVALFDPMPGWSVPTAYDLATFRVGLRLNGWQLASRGAAFDRAGLAARDSAVCAGHGTDPDDPLLRLMVLIVMLDRWSWLASPAPDSGIRGRLSAVKLAWLRSALVAEVRRTPALGR